MATAKTKPISINDQLVAVTQRASKLRASWEPRLSPDVADGIKDPRPQLLRELNGLLGSEGYCDP